VYYGRNGKRKKTLGRQFVADLLTMKSAAFSNA
jgi:hypothetical protein